MKKRRRYAEGTTVDPEASLAEIRRTVRSFNESGQDGFALAEEGGKTTLVFALADRRVRFDVINAKPGERPQGRGRKLTDAGAKAETRRRWRALLLLLKAKLEIVGSGDVPLDAEFMAYIMLTDGRTVGSEVIPRVEQEYETGMPQGPMLRLLTAGPE